MYQCNYCTKETKSKRGMILHTERVHPQMNRHINVMESEPTGDPSLFTTEKLIECLNREVRDFLEDWRMAESRMRDQKTYKALEDEYGMSYERIRTRLARFSGRFNKSAIPSTDERDEVIRRLIETYDTHA